MNARGMNEPKKYPKSPELIWTSKADRRMTPEQMRDFFNAYNAAQTPVK